MSSQSTHAQDSTDPRPSIRPKYIPIGVDGDGAHHCYRTVDETVHIIADGERVWVQDVEPRGINAWIDHIADRRGWEDQRMHKTAFGAVTEAIRR